jgi:hypothetical protein
MSNKDRDSAVERAKKRARAEDRKQRHYEALKRLRLISRRERPRD